MQISDILSIIAIVVSLIVFFLNRQLDSYLYGPKCRIAAYSVSRGLRIQIANGGNRVMHVKKVSYTVCSDVKKIETYTHNLSSLFYDLTCETRSETRPTNEDLFPNSTQNLFTTTFFSQEEMIKAWNIVQHITVKVEYNGIIKQFFPTYRSLKCDYETFMDVISDGKGNIRKLKAFVDTDIKE